MCYDEYVIYASMWYVYVMYDMSSMVWIGKSAVDGPEGQYGMDRKVERVGPEGLLRLWDWKAPVTHWQEGLMEL